MSALINMPRAAWRRQPQGAVTVNWGNPLSRQLQFWFDATKNNAVDLVKGMRPISFLDESGVYSTVSELGKTELFSGDSQFNLEYSLTGNAILSGATESTVDIYFRPKNTTQTPHTFGSWNVVSGNHWLIQQFGANLVWVAAQDTGSNRRRWDATSVFSANRWHHLVLSWQGGANKCAFLNGVNITASLSDVSILATQINTNPSSMRIGSSAGGTPNFECVFARIWNRGMTEGEASELSANHWQLFAPAPSRFYLIPSSGTSSYQLVSSFASASTSSFAALNIQRVLASTCASFSSTPSISLVSLIPLLSALTSASSTATSAWQVLRALQSAPISDSSTSPAALAIERALVSALTSASLSATSALNVQRNFLTALSSESAAPTITMSIAGLLALLSAISSSSSTAAPAIVVQRGLLSALTGQSATGDITLNTTTLIALLSAVASTSLSASSALNIARSLSTAINSPSSTADAALPVQRPLTTAAASQSSTSISALELINLIALMSGVSSQSSTATATANLARALVSSLLSASSTATISLPVLRELASTLVSISLNDAIDLALAVAGQVDLVSMIESGSLTNPQVRLLADLVAAIQTEMKLQMTGVSPSLKMTGSGPSIAVHRT